MSSGAVPSGKRRYRLPLQLPSVPGVTRFERALGQLGWGPGLPPQIGGGQSGVHGWQGSEPRSRGQLFSGHSFPRAGSGHLPVCLAGLPLGLCHRCQASFSGRYLLSQQPRPPSSVHAPSWVSGQPQGCRPLTSLCSPRFCPQTSPPCPRGVDTKPGGRFWDSRTIPLGDPVEQGGCLARPPWL